MNTAGFFQSYFENAVIHCILIMDAEGSVLDVSKSFTKNFGYQLEDIRGKNFSILFSDEERQIQKPQHELAKVLKAGQASDENFIIHQNGAPIWCTGESVTVPSEEGTYIVKDIVNLQTTKQVRFLLTEAETVLDTLFKSSAEIPLMILDGGMRIQKINQAFKDLFDLGEQEIEHAKVSDLNHSFWNSPELKKELRSLIVHKIPMVNSIYPLQTSGGETRRISMKSKCIQKNGESETKFYIMLEEVME